jgi:hypothetical protein
MFTRFKIENEASDGFSDLMSAAGDPTGDVVGDESGATSGPIPDREQEYEYSARKGKIKEPISMILKRASQGYDYAHLMNEFNEKNKTFDSRFKHYEEIDRFAQENKEWWESVNKSYQERVGQGQQPLQQPEQAQTTLPPELQSVLNPLTQELTTLKESLGEILKERNEARQQKEDSALLEQITGIRQQYKDVDFDTLDENGKSLEFKVLQHAQESGIKNFKTAFLDFYHENLTKLHEETGREAAVKNLQSKTRLGLLRDSAPRQQPQRSIREMSYNDLIEEALRESNN